VKHQVEPSKGLMLIWTIELIENQRMDLAGEYRDGYSTVPKLFGGPEACGMDISHKVPATSRWNPALRPVFDSIKNLVTPGGLGVPQGLVKTWIPISRDILPIQEFILQISCYQKLLGNSELVNLRHSGGARVEGLAEAVYKEIKKSANAEFFADVKHTVIHIVPVTNEDGNTIACDSDLSLDLLAWANALSMSERYLAEKDVDRPNQRLISVMARDITLTAPHHPHEDWDLVQVRALVVDAIALGVFQSHVIEEKVREIGGIHQSPGKGAPTSTALRHDFYSFRSKYWWQKPSTNNVINSTWKKYAEQNSLLASMDQISEELNDYSTVELSQRQEVIGYGAFAIAIVALVMTGAFEMFTDDAVVANVVIGALSVLAFVAITLWLRRRWRS